MRFVIGVFLTCLAVAWAQEPTTVTISETTFNSADVVVIPFPEKSATITFALTDESAPDPMSLKFNAPTAETLAAWAVQVQREIERRSEESGETVRGLGGDPLALALAAYYQELIKEQAEIERKIQRYLDAIVKLRCMMEIVRQAAQQNN